MPPAPIPFEQSLQLICHDVSAYGLHDSELFPRLNQKEALFKLWDSSNPLFFDNNSDGYIDANNWIHDYAKSMNLDVPLDTRWFIPFKISGNHPMGYIMPYWVDATTLQSFCLTSHHYNSNNYQTRIYKIFHELLAVETEGLYVGIRLSGKKDLLFINESELKRIWFYYLNGKPAVPDNLIVSQHSIYFVSKGSVFQLISLQELNRDSIGSEGFPETHYPSHDRKIGCIPKTMLK